MLIQPPGFPSGKKYPAVVYVAGGPGQQAVRDAWDGDVTMWQQLLAQRGYVVFAVDNRGTAGRGHLFEEPIHYKLSGKKCRIRQMALHFLRSLPYVDPERIGIWGKRFRRNADGECDAASSDWALKAGFAVAPIVDWFHYDTFFTERYLGSPVSNQDGYLSSSPLDDARLSQIFLAGRARNGRLAGTSRAGHGTAARTCRRPKVRRNRALSGAAAHYRWAGCLCSLISAGD